MPLELDGLHPSQALAQSLERAMRYAREQAHALVSVEHLLLALTEDPDAVVSLQACTPDLSRLRDDIAAYVAGLDNRLDPRGPVEPQASEDLKVTCARAAAAARQMGRQEITSFAVLATIVGEHETPAARILQSHGFTFEKALNAFRLDPANSLEGSEHDPIAALPGDEAAAGAVHGPFQQAAHASPAAPDFDPHHDDGGDAAMPRRGAPADPAHDTGAPARSAAAHSRPHDARLGMPVPLGAPQTVDDVMASVRAMMELAVHKAGGGAPPGSLAGAPARQRRRAEPAAIEPWPADPDGSLDGFGPGSATSGTPHANEPSFAPGQSGGAPDWQSGQYQPPDTRTDIAAPGLGTEAPAAQYAGSAPPGAQSPALPPLSQPSQPRAPGAAPAWVRQPSQPPGLPGAGIAQAPPAPLPSRSSGRGAQHHPPGTESSQRDPAARPPRPPRQAPGRGLTPVPQRPIDLRVSQNDLIAGAPYLAMDEIDPPSRPVAPGDYAQTGSSGGRRPGTQLEPVRTPPRRAAAPALDTAQLIQAFPNQLRAGIAVPVEVRIARREIEAMAEGLQGRNSAPSGSPFAVPLVAMTVRLTAPRGGLQIELATPETQWIENSLGLIQHDEQVSWRWSLMPLKRGRHQLLLRVGVRTIGPDGLGAETALPTQGIEVRTGRNYGQSLRRWAGSGLAFVLGVAMAMLAADTFEPGLRAAARLLSAALGRG